MIDLRIYSQADFLEMSERNRQKLVKQGHAKFKTKQEKIEDIKLEELNERIKLRRRTGFNNPSEKGKKLRAIHDNQKLGKWIG